MRSASLAPLPESRCAMGKLLAAVLRSRIGDDARKNSVVNAADTSTDRSIEWAALSAKNSVAPLLVKTHEKMYRSHNFYGELRHENLSVPGTKRSKGEDSAIAATALHGLVLPDLHRIGYTQNLPVRQ